MLPVRRERRPHESNILGFEPGRCTANILGQSARFCANPLTLRAELACRVLPFLQSFSTLVARARGVWNGLNCGTMCWTLRFGNLQLVGKLRESAFDSQRTTAERKIIDEADQVIPWKTVDGCSTICAGLRTCTQWRTMDHLTSILRDMTKGEKSHCCCRALHGAQDGDVIEIFSNKG